MYRSCIGENEASISTLQMLTNIENRLEELFEKIEKMPPSKVEEAEKVGARFVQAAWMNRLRRCVLVCAC